MDKIIIKQDTRDNWAKAKNFTPKEGELIIFSDTNELRIGDGVTNVNELPVVLSVNAGALRIGYEEAYNGEMEE